MAELYGLSLGQHLESITSELKTSGTIYGYPAKKFYKGFKGFDFSVDFHEKRPATALGPASGPHTQLAQNIILSFLGGGRIMELKTIQILDQLEIPRPCIDARNICYNVEWSQELRLEQSYHEYVTAWILLKIIEESEMLGVPKGDPFYHTVFDLSVGYNLEGISTDKVKNWIEKMKDAGEAIQEALSSLPEKFACYKDLAIDPKIADSVTLSTFHGCPRDEIEAIVKHLIAEHNLHVIVKMNPTLLGHEFVAKTLQQNLGFSHIELDPKTFETDLQFDEAVAMMKRLEKFGAEHNRKVGAKFTNTLIVKNKEKVFKDEVMYLSGAPLHVLAMNSMHRLRSEIGDHFHISFSAGITNHNFAEAMLCNMKPITVCTDLLTVGGYTRLYDKMKNLKQAMEKSEAENIAQYIISAAEGKDSIESAGAANAARIVPALVENKRYHYETNKKPPKKVESHLEFFDCLTCNKCLPVCPNAANFSIDIGKLQVATTNYDYSDGKFTPTSGPDFVLTKKSQIANFADFCNECGNCDTFCPEHGGPFIEKPRFFTNEKTYRIHSDYDGFYFADANTLVGRIDKKEYSLSWISDEYRWISPECQLVLDKDMKLVSGKTTDESLKHVDMKNFYAMHALLHGMIDAAGAYPADILRQSAV